MNAFTSRSLSSMDNKPGSKLPQKPKQSFCFPTSDFEQPIDEAHENEWQAKFVQYHKHLGDKFYKDLIAYHQLLVDQMLSVVARDHEAFLQFGTKVRYISKSVNERLEALRQINAVVARESRVDASAKELNTLLDEKQKICERRINALLRLSVAETEKRRLKLAPQNKSDRKPVNADQAASNAIMHVYNACSEVSDNNTSKWIISELVDDFVFALDDPRVSDGHQLKVMYEALRVMGLSSSQISLQVVEKLREAGPFSQYEHLMGQVKERFSKTLDYPEILCHIVWRWVEHSLSSYQPAERQLSDAAETTAEAFAKSLDEIKTGLMEPFRKWCDTNAEWTDRVYFKFLNTHSFSSSLYKSLRSAELCRSMEEAFVRSGRSSSGSESCSLDCLGCMCCLANTTFLKCVQLCIEDNQIADLRSHILTLLSRYDKWLERQRKPVDCNEKKTSVHDKIRELVGELRTLNRVLEMVTLHCGIDDIGVETTRLVSTRVSGRMAVAVQDRIRDLICHPSAFNRVHDLPKMFVRKDASVNPDLIQPYVSDSLTCIEEWWPKLNHPLLSHLTSAEDKKMPLHAHCVLTLVGQYKDAIVGMLIEVEKVRSGLARLRLARSKRNSATVGSAMANNDRRVESQLHADVARFTKTVKQIIEKHGLDAEYDEKIQMALVDLNECISESQ